MPETLQKSTVDSNIDPSVAVSWDDKTPKSQQIEDFYKTVDAMKSCMLTTIRDGIGLVSRSMVVGKREGPDFLFLANKDSTKFADLSKDKTAQVTFQDSSSQDWVSISGTVVTTSNDDPRIKQLYNKGTAAWFGDIGDGVHNGTAEDPRLALLEVKAKYVAYWKCTVSSLGFAKEVVQASLMGSVANIGLQRELTPEDIEGMRKTNAA